MTSLGAVWGEHHERLRRHCYRMTGSFTAAEAAVLEASRRVRQTMEAGGDAPASPVQLYQLATGCALEVVEAKDRRQILIDQLTMVEPTWLEPYPTGSWTVGGLAADDEALGEPPEWLSLSAAVGLQLLPTRQRAAMLLHDVMGLGPDDVASVIGVGTAALARLLDAARFVLDGHFDEWPASPDRDEHREMSTQFGRRWATDDTTALAASLADDVTLLMPADSLTIHGSRGVMAGLSELTHGRLSTLGLVDVELNGSVAHAGLPPEGVGSGRPFGLLHLDVAEGVITRLTVFDDRLFGRLGLTTSMHE